MRFLRGQFDKRWLDWIRSRLLKENNNMKIQRQYLLFIFVGLMGAFEFTFLSATASAAVYDQYTPSRHNRFSSENVLDGAGESIYLPNVDPGFILSGYDLSGIGVSTPASLNDVDGMVIESTGRAVLITPQHYIAAAHAGTSNPRFVGSDGVSRAYGADSRTVLTTNFADGSSEPSDIALFRLAAPIPAAHGVNPFAIYAGGAADLVGKEFFLNSNPLRNVDAMGDPDGELTHRLGKNVIRDIGVIGFGATSSSPTVSIFYTFDPTDPSKANADGTFGPDSIPSDSLGIDEAGLIGGDSGHTALINVDGQLAVIGAHFGITNTSDAAAGNFYGNFSSLLSPYLDEIDALTMPTPGDGFLASRLSFATAVPEPNCFFCLSLALVGIVHRRRR
jgi:hypothetical protein